MRDIGAACMSVSAGIEGIVAMAAIDLMTGALLGGAEFDTLGDDVRECLQTACRELTSGRATVLPPPLGETAELALGAARGVKGENLRVLVAPLPLPYVLLVIVAREQTHDPLAPCHACEDAGLAAFTG